MRAWGARDPGSIPGTPTNRDILKIMKGTFNLLDIKSVRPIVREMLRYKKSGSVLDLGCGAGRHALFLAKKGFYVTAIDNRTEVLAALKELARLQKLPITVQKGDATAYSSKKKFDIILSTMVLHFLPRREQKEAILIMQEHTKQGGVNVVSAYTDKSRRGTRPHLVRAGGMKRAYENRGWHTLHHQERRGKLMVSSSGGVVRYWIEELIAQKP